MHVSRSHTGCMASARCEAAELLQPSRSRKYAWHGVVFQQQVQWEGAESRCQ